MDRQSMLEGELFDGAGSGFAAATRGTVGLGIDRRDGVPMVQQRLETGHRKFRRTGKYNIQGYALHGYARLFFQFFANALLL